MEQNCVKNTWIHYLEIYICYCHSTKSKSLKHVTCLFLLSIQTALANMLLASKSFRALVFSRYSVIFVPQLILHYAWIWLTLVRLCASKLYKLNLNVHFEIFPSVQQLQLTVVTATTLTVLYQKKSNSSLLSSSKMASVDSLFACELLEIRLSTVIVHCVETSVIVKQNVLRDFSTQELKNGGTNKKQTKEKKKKKTKKHDTTWASIYCTLYICHSICLIMEDLKVYVN